MATEGQEPVEELTYEQLVDEMGFDPAHPELSDPGPQHVEDADGTDTSGSDLEQNRDHDCLTSDDHQLQGKRPGVPNIER